MLNSWFEIFKTGEHTDSAGKKKNWTEADLNYMVEKYDPEQHEAPIVIGHPQNNNPAFGWMEALKRKGRILYAKAKDLVPEFVEMVKKGLLKKRSIMVYPDGTLRHIGFLGAMPPAVKGLADIRFRESEQLTYSEIEGEKIFLGEEKDMRSNDPGLELQRRINEVLRNPPRCDKYGREFSGEFTYTKAFEYVCEEDPELARQYFERIKPPHGTFEFNESAGAKLVELVEAKMKSDKSLSYSEAFIKVQLANPDLVREYMRR